MFARDRDLLAYEPDLFRDVAWSGQRLVKALGSILSGTTTLMIGTQDVNFTEAGVEAGYVVVVGGTPYEVIERVGDLSVTVSRVRQDDDDPLITPSPASTATTTVVSYRPQLRMVHDQLLRTIGIEPEDPAELERVTEADITNPGALKAIEAMSTIHMVLSSAAALSGPDSTLWRRAQHYRDLVARERQRVGVRIDLDGDGVPDATRRLNVVQFMR